MHNVGISFEVLENNSFPSVGSWKVTGNLIFDVKVYFTGKEDIWLLYGHKTPDPIGPTYAGVVYRYSIKISFTHSSLNSLYLCVLDISNAYLQAPSLQKYFVIYGKWFGLENIGKKFLIRRALYSGKYSGRDSRNHIHACMRHMHFVPCLSDPDVWMRPINNSDGS